MRLKSSNGTDLHIAPCKGCGACQRYGGCVDDDRYKSHDADASTAADVSLFADCGGLAGNVFKRLELIVDQVLLPRMQLKKKEVGADFVVGGFPVDSIQYVLIGNQIRLAWRNIFHGI